MSNEALSGPKALGHFLRTRRESTSPEMLGIATTARRRTRGLRREELAQLSGISTTWYTWIEQGRDVAVSARTLSNIADALRMDTAERGYLFRLAQLSDDRAGQANNVDMSALACVHKVCTPCYVLDINWDLLAWNQATQTLFSGWLESDPAPNMMKFMYLHPLAKTLVPDWEARCGRIVAELRAESIHYMQETRLQTFVHEMSAASEVFRTQWARQQVTERRGGERHFHHIILGDLRYTQVSWSLSGNHAVKMVMLLEDTESKA